MRHARTTDDDGDAPWGPPSQARPGSDGDPAGETWAEPTWLDDEEPGRPGRRRNGAVTVATVVPLVLTLVLLTTAGPGRLASRPAAGTRVVAAPARATDSTRLASLINQERVRHGLAPLMVSRRLNTLATAHSADMAGQKRLWADPDPGAGTLADIALSEHVDCASSVEQAFERLMSSPAQRARVLQPSLNALGLGTAGGSCLWVTAMFAKAPAKRQSGSVTRTTVAPTTTVPPRSATTTTGAATTTRATPSTAAPAPAPSGASSTAQAIVKDLFGRLNAERAARGLPALAWDADLARMATDWSSHMASAGTFAHRELSTARSLPGISKFSALGENIAWVQGYPNDAFQLHTGWMKSDEHRQNMLQPGFDSVGIGVVCSAGGQAWATQDFGKASSSTPAMSSAIPSQDPIVAVKLDGLAC